MTGQLTQGQIFSHLTVGSSDMDRSVRFYDAVLAPVGLVRLKSFRAASGYGPKDFAGINLPFWILRPQDRKAASAGNGVTVAFTVPSRAAVDAFHAAALANGGTDDAHPGCAPIIIRIITAYHPDYYGAYVRDPEGNKVCAVCHVKA
jgi:catechol 2,3-dioxygenase-like lactoylglutathione lyase family enzyme